MSLLLGLVHVIATVVTVFFLMSILAIVLLVEMVDVIGEGVEVLQFLHLVRRGPRHHWRWWYSFSGTYTVGMIVFAMVCCPVFLMFMMLFDFRRVLGRVVQLIMLARCMMLFRPLVLMRQ